MHRFVLLFFLPIRHQCNPIQEAGEEHDSTELAETQRLSKEKDNVPLNESEQTVLLNGLK